MENWHCCNKIAPPKDQISRYAMFELQKRHYDKYQIVNTNSLRVISSSHNAQQFTLMMQAFVASLQVGFLMSGKEPKFTH